MDAGFRFGNLNLDECITKGKEIQNKNTLNNEKKSVAIVKHYLGSLGLEDTDFFHFIKDELDHYLTTFWWNACTQKGEEYSASSMETIRYSLNRALVSFVITLTLPTRTAFHLRSQFNHSKTPKRTEERGVKAVLKIPKNVNKEIFVTFKQLSIAHHK